MKWVQTCMSNDARLTWAVLHRCSLMCCGWTKVCARRRADVCIAAPLKMSFCWPGPFAASLARQLANMCSTKKLRPESSVWKTAVDGLLLRATAISMEVHEEARPASGGNCSRALILRR